MSVSPIQTVLRLLAYGNRWISRDDVGCYVHWPALTVITLRYINWSISIVVLHSKWEKVWPKSLFLRWLVCYHLEPVEAQRLQRPQSHKPNIATVHPHNLPTAPLTTAQRCPDSFWYVINTLEPDLIIHYLLKMEFLSVSVNLTRTLKSHHLHVHACVHVHFMWTTKSSANLEGACSICTCITTSTVQAREELRRSSTCLLETSGSIFFRIVWLDTCTLITCRRNVTWVHISSGQTTADAKKAPPDWLINYI